MVAAAAKGALDNPGVDPRLTSKSLAASRMLRVLVEVFQSFLKFLWSSSRMCLMAHFNKSGVPASGQGFSLAMSTGVPRSRHSPGTAPAQSPIITPLPPAAQTTSATQLSMGSRWGVSLAWLLIPTATIT
jgi:hypothetical protein